MILLFLLLDEEKIINKKTTKRKQSFLQVYVCMTDSRKVSMCVSTIYFYHSECCGNIAELR